MFEKPKIKNIKEVPKDEYYVSGHRTCAGCGPALTLRLIAKAAGPKTMYTGATGCMYVANTSYWTTPWAVPWIHTQLGATGSAVIGMAAAVRAMRRKEKRKDEPINVIGLAGDGGTADIGLSAISEAMSDDQDLLVVTYDNESYANTGIQASSLTSWGAWTTFTPPGKLIRVGNVREKKNLVMMLAAGHPNVRYLATATIGYPLDLMTKVRKALSIGGPTFVHILAPCPKGWRFDANKSVKISRLAVQTGMWILYEIERGKFRINLKVRKRKPVSAYLKPQGRFSHLKKIDIMAIQKKVDERVKEYGFGDVIEK
jgi:pyruvate/2-oxoacid:ferredoxin oxidoreductase beta subunit